MKLPKLLKWITGTVAILRLLVGLWYSSWIIAYLIRHVWDGRYRTFNTVYKEVEIGATRQEVESIIKQHYPAGGERLPPKVLESTSSTMSMFMNPEHSKEPNCELIEFNFTNGKVTNKQYT